MLVYLGLGVEGSIINPMKGDDIKKGIYIYINQYTKQY